MEQTNDYNNRDECSPDRSPSPQLPSPTGCLSPEMMEKLHEDITDANELLLDLALADKRPPEETFQKVFEGLTDMRVELTNKTGETTEGKVMLAGYDFVDLLAEEKIHLFPYREIDFIKHFVPYDEPFPDPELTHIDPCFRRDLTFHFGEVVASSPELIQLFFRIRLSMYLRSFIEKRLQVTANHSTVEGILTKVNKDSIEIQSGNENQLIPIELISLITIAK